MRHVFSICIVVTLVGYVMIWIGLYWSDSIMTTIGGILFGGGIVHGTLGRRWDSD